MPLLLRDRVGIFAIFPIFVLNIIVSTAMVILYRVEPIVGIVVGWSYMYVLLLQTRLMLLLIVVGALFVPLVAQFTQRVSVEVGLYAVGLLAATTVAAHIVAFGISAITGFRI